MVTHSPGSSLKAFVGLAFCVWFCVTCCLLNYFLPLFLPSPLFLDTSRIWWQDPPSLAAVEASWDVAEMAAPHKAVDEDSDLSHLEGDSAEELGVQDPVSIGLNVESVFPLSIRKEETFYNSMFKCSAASPWARGVPMPCAAHTSHALGFRSWRPSKPECGRWRKRTRG